MKIEKRKISDLKNWENNPRTITAEAFERLKKQIVELAPYKPLLINEEGVVLGGNMRLRAFKEMGIEEIECSIVSAPTEELKLKYALSDNDQVGKTDSEILINLVGSLPDIDFSNFAVHLEEPTNIKGLMKTTLSEGGNLGTKTLVVLMTDGQYNVVQDAFSKVREQSDIEINDARCCELICGDYLTGK